MAHRFLLAEATGEMRFVSYLWLLILSSLVLFTIVVASHQIFAPGLPPVAVWASLLVGAWIVGIISAASIHFVYRRAESAIEKAARDETVLQLAGAVAHEMNQPLTVIVSGADLLAHPNRSPEEMRALASRMAEASERMANIVAKLQRATCYRPMHYVGKVNIVDLDGAAQEQVGIRSEPDGEFGTKGGEKRAAGG